MRLLCQFVERFDKVLHRLPADEERQQQTNQNQWNNDEGQSVICREYIFLRTYQGDAPICALHGLIEDKVGLALVANALSSCLSCRHLLAQFRNLRIFLGVVSREDGLFHQLHAVGVHKVMSVRPQHDTVGIGVRLLG